jgi:hypothetical protein
MMFDRSFDFFIVIFYISSLSGKKKENAFSYEDGRYTKKKKRKKKKKKKKKKKRAI